MLLSWLLLCLATSWGDKTFLVETRDKAPENGGGKKSQAKNGSDYGYYWGEGTGGFDMNMEPLIEEYGDVAEPKWQPKMIKNHWADLGKGFTCATSGTDGCEKRDICGCRLVNFWGNIYNKKKKWVGTMSSQWSGSYKASNCFDWDPRTSCSTKGNKDKAPWIYIDMGGTRKVGAVSLFATNTNAKKIANVQVRITKTKPTISSSRMFSGGDLIGTFQGPARDNDEIGIATSSPKKGRFLIVQMENGGQYLSLLDIKVTDPKCQNRGSKGADYKGDADVTVGNRVCQMWGSSRPHSTGKYGAMVDSAAGHNGCRNPSGSSGGVWCYTVDPAKKWEFCAVPYC